MLPARADGHHGRADAVCRAPASCRKKIGQDRVRHASRNLRFCLSGGETLSAALLHRWKQFAGVEILDGVGTTEMTHMCIVNQPGRSVPWQLRKAGQWLSRRNRR
ncbi:MAG: AMP-binding protein [Pseudorhodoplanes sp.]|uniref:AMP-binding protein n=1 Tax=Pseudorhodoplanes sp. TaxID=1934341 RepID=UPI003D09627A